MSLIKMTSLAFVILFCTLCGAWLAGGLKRRTSALKKTQLFLHMLCERLGYTLCPLDELFEALAQEPHLAELDFIPLCSGKLAQHIPFPQAFEDSLSMCGCALDKSDRALLAQAASILGASTAENQLSSLRLVQANLAEQTRQAQTAVDKRAKLYSSLGVLSGVALAIVLL